MCLVSVIIPTYNRQETIYQSVQSVLNQTVESLEVIIVDDGSTDNTKQVIQSIDDHRVKYFFQRNNGACAARNYGILHSNGDYIAFQDSDDLWYENKLKQQIHCLEKNNADVCICRMRVNDGNKSYVFPSKRITNSCLSLERLLEKNFGSTQTILAKKSVFLSERFDEEFPRFQDWDLMIRLYRKYKVVLYEDVLVEQNQQKDSISKDNEKFLIAAKLLEKKYKEIWDLYPVQFSSLLRQTGKIYIRLNNRETSYAYFKRSLKVHFSLKTLLRILECKVR